MLANTQIKYPHPFDNAMFGVGGCNVVRKLKFFEQQYLLTVTYFVVYLCNGHLIRQCVNVSM